MGYTVYMHLNKINGKKYIGITSRKTYERWSTQGNGYDNCPKFSKAIQKYGWDGFYHIILFKGLWEPQALLMERQLIKKYKTQDDNFGYNVADGGDINNFLGRTHTDENKKIMSQKRSGQRLGKNNTFYGHTHSEETKQKLSEISSQQVLSEETKQRISKHSSTKKAVKCIELDMIFNSIKEAADYFGINSSSLVRTCKGRYQTCGGYHWEYVTIDPKPVVRCIETQEEFTTLNDAAKAVGLKTSCHIRSACTGKRMSAGGFHWEYIS